jgi:hypothetical protein
MSRRNHRSIPAPLSRARTRFEAWRLERVEGTRIPEQLWTLAVNLADAHGLSRTASVLRLDYYALKKRLESTTANARSASSAFVELSPSPWAASGECVIEFEKDSGSSMRVHLRGCEMPDLVALGRSFWGDR